MKFLTRFWFIVLFCYSGVAFGFRDIMIDTTTEMKCWIIDWYTPGDCDGCTWVFTLKNTNGELIDQTTADSCGNYHSFEWCPPPLDYHLLDETYYVVASSDCHWWCGCHPRSEVPCGACRDSICGCNVVEFGKYLVFSGDMPCPVELSSFTATSGDNKVVLRWRTESEVNNAYFKLYRSQNDSTRGEQIARIAGSGTTANQHEYSFIDVRVTNGTEYHYRLADVDFDGVEAEHRARARATPNVSTLSETPAKYRLWANYPNPFNPTTEISYCIRDGGHIRLTVSDIYGREVSRLVDGYQDANTYCVKFNAKNFASGVYFYTLSSAKFTTTKRMVIMK